MIPWINQWASLQSAGEFIYDLNELGEEQDTNTTLIKLTKEILISCGLTNEAAWKVDSKEAQLYRAFAEHFARSLAILMHRSFLVKIPGGQGYQEFDGINDLGVILERKENNGSGEGPLQTNFTQRKINEKSTFFMVVRDNEHKFKKKDIALRLCDGKKVYPTKQYWYSDKLDKECREKFYKAAKQILVNAINNPKIEFIFNDTGSDIK